MRGTVEGLESSHPIGLELPGLFHDDDVAQRFVAGLDDILAPIFLTLDAVESYIDPWLAPRDFLAWLAEWVSAPWDGALSDMQQRTVVARAAELLGWAGTARGLAGMIELVAGVRPEIEENGATAWTIEPGGDIPGSDQAAVTVRVRVEDLPSAGPEREDRIARVRQVVHSFLPAHVVATVEVSNS
jgi:phage tail-like protein